MDRLICGDVGYGKTEVAMRAAFLAVEGGKQVAVLAPTTILAQQHLQTFRHRFRNHPVRIEMVSRFLTTQRNRAGSPTRPPRARSISSIGTHRLLQKDVEFKDLGLVIIDEEHRFGVVHKERLKKLRAAGRCVQSDRDADPAHLAYVAGRHSRFEHYRNAAGGSAGDSNLRDALRRAGHPRRHSARDRSGAARCFFSTTGSKPSIAWRSNLSDLIPEAKMAVAHGQMRPKELEKVMLDFLENKTQVLVCSAIIESGLDFPNANTIIINRADQLRPRPALSAARPGRALASPCVSPIY